jgi:hypothetical protein
MRIQPLATQATAPNRPPVAPQWVATFKHYEAIAPSFIEAWNDMLILIAYDMAKREEAEK